MNKNLNKYPGIYRCPDDINNLNIRIVMINEQTGEEFTKTVKWQQKFFSKFEKEFYSNEKNCITELEWQYHNDILNLGNVDDSLYTYTKFDDFCSERDMNSKFKGPAIDDDDDKLDNYDFKMSLTNSIKTVINFKQFEVMYIVADFGEYMENAWIKDEKVVCTVKFNEKNRILQIFPDFTHTEPYSLQVESDSIKNYLYFIENASVQMPDELLLKQTEFQKKITACTQIVRIRQIDTINPIDAPLRNKLQVYLFFGILWAKNFEYDNIHVQYSIDLPLNWSCANPETLHGATQRCCRTRTDQNIAHFDHHFELVLEWELIQNVFPRCPTIYFEIISKDCWDRYRSEGLTYKILPITKPGIYLDKLHCFRLCPNGVSGDLRRFFIGDCSNYDDITWIGIPKDHEDDCLNKFGTKTVPTGVLSLTTNIVHRSCAFFAQHDEDDRSKEILKSFDRLNASNLVKSVEQVLCEFKKARKNMLNVRRQL